jgi:nicotinamide mononucleotide transporter
VDFLSVDTIAFTVLGYPMSYIELVGTVLYLWSVWLIARRNILTWPIGIASVILYMILFFQIRLYADTLEQGYYLIASVYGWWHWSKPVRQENASNSPVDVQYSSWKNITIALVITAVLSVVLSAVMSQIHLILPSLFPEPASYPFLDSLTTIMSFTAMWLMVRKHIESWFYWIVVDVIGIGLYFAKDVKFISLLYVILLILAVQGLWSWHKATKSPHPLPVAV